ncbi:MAG: LysM peptidoglycan-binding domain-containing protein [Flavobacteriaceae bacterium]|nr:LysM peptidoglycan-binding domain-containing protein [Flavobacteriaceae bacterium]
MKLLVTFIFLFSLTVSLAHSPFQDKYRSHRVKQGETVYSIAKTYNVSENEIYKLNPDARGGISSNSILIIPSSDVINAASQEIKFKKHKVRRKETLYSIARKYNVSEDDIKKYNKHLYSKGLKKGEKLQIPISLAKTETVTVVSNNTSEASNNYATHVVAAKETKYGIARKYGISIAELDDLNPNLPENFPIGTELKVPKTSVTTSATIEEESFDFYEVQPKEGFFRLKVKLGLSQEEIVALNPYAKDGLKDGMILKIPKESTDSSPISEKIDLENAISNRDPKRLALLLPFQLKSATDSIKANTELIKNNRTMRIALDFYSGVLMASEFLKDKGISVELNVYDTEGSAAKTTAIISRNDFSSIDAVIGPLLSKNVERAASDLKSKDVPVFSPLSNRSIKLTSNLFQTLPPDSMLEKAMIEYLKENSEGKNVIVICDGKKAKQKTALMEAIPEAISIAPREKGFLYVVDIEEKIDKTRENWVILESEDPVILSNVIGLLNGMPETHQIRLFTTDKNENYDYHDVSNVHLANLDFTFPSISRTYNFDEKNAFLVSYKNKYGVLPNRFAVRGFDLTYDILLRLASSGNVYDASNNDYETEYVENKFNYQKKMFSGYRNNAFYILKFNKDLQLEVVK